MSDELGKELERECLATFLGAIGFKKVAEGPELAELSPKDLFELAKSTDYVFTGGELWAKPEQNQEA